MKYYCYILYSKALDRYYTGYTSLSPKERLSNHLSSFYGTTKFTSKANDWILFWSIECSSPLQAQKIERHIKKMRNRKYIENLSKYPEIGVKLKTRYID
ncbi:MAG: GIY-YIG nuclease family protein [Bacteroidales bacterium]|nr:GIY-YIG nuclease family protein [Bacteroidales bacterium]